MGRGDAVRIDKQIAITLGSNRALIAVPTTLGPCSGPHLTQKLGLWRRCSCVISPDSLVPRKIADQTLLQSSETTDNDNQDLQSVFFVNRRGEGVLFSLALHHGR
jgi:hypothetical protein